jgi:hypothetical protein
VGRTQHPPASAGKIAVIIPVVLLAAGPLLLLALHGRIFGGDEGHSLPTPKAIHDPTCAQVARAVKHDDGDRSGPGWLTVDRATVFGEAYDAPTPKRTPVVLLVCQLTGTRAGRAAHRRHRPMGRGPGGHSVGLL